MNMATSLQKAGLIRFFVDVCALWLWGVWQWIFSFLMKPPFHYLFLKTSRPVAYKPVASGSPLSPYGVSPNGRPPSCQSAPPADYLVSLDGRRSGEATAQDSFVVYTDTEEYEVSLFVYHRNLH